MAAENVTNVNHKAEADAVADILRKTPTLTRVKGGTVDDVDVLLVPNGMTPVGVKKLLDEYRQAPERREGTAIFTDLKSMVAHTNRFKDDDSTVWLDRSSPHAQQGPRLISVLDYHRKGAEGAPRFGKHRGRYDFPLSEEWKAWIGQDGQSMQQEAFARWLEDHLTDVSEPASALGNAKEFATLHGATYASPGKLLDLSKGLDIHIGQRVKEHRNAQTGEKTLMFEEGHADATGQPLKVPSAFLLTIPVFRAGAAYQLPCRLRYRVNGSGVTWSYEVHRAQDTLDHALEEACELVREQTALPVFDGTPE